MDSQTQNGWLRPRHPSLKRLKIETDLWEECKSKIAETEAKEEKIKEIELHNWTLFQYNK